MSNAIEHVREMIAERDELLKLCVKRLPVVRFACDQGIKIVRH